MKDDDEMTTVERWNKQRDDYFDIVNVEPILSKKEKAKKEKEMAKEIREKIEPEFNTWVRFSDMGSYFTLPSNVFVLSDFSFGLLKGSKLYFTDNLEIDARKWLKNKAREYQKYSSVGGPLEGAFWDNIIKQYKEAGKALEHYHDGNAVLSLDNIADRKIYKSKIEKIRTNKKGMNDVNDRDDIDKLLNGLGGWDNDDGRPTKPKKPSNDEMLANRFGELEKRVDDAKMTKSINDSVYGTANSTSTTVSNSRIQAGAVEIEGDLKINGEMLVWDEATSGWKKVNLKGNTMRIDNVKNTIVAEVKELVNQSGAADIALGRILYNNIKSAMGKTVVKISFVDRAVAKVSKKMKYKNEVTELIGVLTMLVILKQFYDHKALSNVRGYAVNRLYTLGIEATGMDDVLALISQAEKKAVND